MNWVRAIVFCGHRRIVFPLGRRTGRHLLAVARRGCQTFSGPAGKTDLKLVQDNAHGTPSFTENIFTSTNSAPVTNSGGNTSFAISNSSVVSFGGSQGASVLNFFPPWPMLNNSLLTSGDTATSFFNATLGTTNLSMTGVTTVQSAGNVVMPGRSLSRLLVGPVFAQHFWPAEYSFRNTCWRRKNRNYPNCNFEQQFPVP